MDTAQSIWAGIALVTTLALCFMPAPYGRHAPTGASFWTRGHNSRIAFFVMEFPAFFIYLIAFVMSPHKTPVSTMFFLLFELHYTRRTFLYPLKMKASSTYPIYVWLIPTKIMSISSSDSTYGYLL